MKRDYPALLQPAPPGVVHEPPNAVREPLNAAGSCDTACEPATRAPGKWVSAPGHQLPVISIVTCSFQQRRYLEQTMRSVLDQGYPRLEYIVIDGGSTDGSVEIIRRYERALAHWESVPDRGQTDALANGFRRATGQIHGWLCADDLLLPGALAAVAEFFAARVEAMAVYGDALWIDAGGRFLRAKEEVQPSMFWRSSLYAAVNGLDPRFDLAMDADLSARFSEVARIHHMSRYLSCIRWYEQQETRSRRPEGGIDDCAIRMRGRAGARHFLVQRVLRIGTRCMRVAVKAGAGAYGAQVPATDLAWLERHAAEKAAG